ncbi:hypothetical protein RIR_jg12141.t1 [Rhizophagus irregularis DAOM 181602=DAOM 197198]|nr:hypothetical protein RIR_jg12141.t1 [Rhizophagus irregularis DAOM 181602=DAOM 197198]
MTLRSCLVSIDSLIIPIIDKSFSADADTNNDEDSDTNNDENANTNNGEDSGNDKDTNTTNYEDANSVSDNKNTNSNNNDNKYKVDSRSINKKLDIKKSRRILKTQYVKDYIIVNFIEILLTNNTIIICLFNVESFSS